MFSEQHLNELLDFIAGRGRFALLGGGMFTYPGRGPEEDAKHAACEELERRGLIVRHFNRPGDVCWKATPASGARLPLFH